MGTQPTLVGTGSTTIAARRSACRSMSFRLASTSLKGSTTTFFHDLFGQTNGIRHLRGLLRVAPALRRGAQADLHGVVAAVVGTFALRDHRPAGMRTGRLDRDEHRLAPRIAEPHRFHRLDPLGDDLGELDLALGRHRETAPAPDLLDDRLDHLGASMPVDEGHVVVETVDPLHSVRVGDLAAAPRRRVDRIRREERREPGAPAREHLASAAVECGGPGFLVGVGHGHGERPLREAAGAHGARLSITPAASATQRAGPDSSRCHRHCNRAAFRLRHPGIQPAISSTPRGSDAKPR